MNRPLWQWCMMAWFFLTGLSALSTFHFALEGVVLGVLAIATAVLWILGK